MYTVRGVLVCQEQAYIPYRYTVGDEYLPNEKKKHWIGQRNKARVDILMLAHIF